MASSTEAAIAPGAWGMSRSEEHTSELQSRLHLVCRLLLEKKKKSLVKGTSSLEPQRRRTPRSVAHAASRGRSACSRHWSAPSDCSRATYHPNTHSSHTARV